MGLFEEQIEHLSNQLFLIRNDYDTIIFERRKEMAEILQRIVTLIRENRYHRKGTYESGDRKIEINENSIVTDFGTFVIHPMVCPLTKITDHDLYSNFGIMSLVEYEKIKADMEGFLPNLTQACLKFQKERLESEILYYQKQLEKLK